MTDKKPRQSYAWPQPLCGAVPAIAIALFCLCGVQAADTSLGISDSENKRIVLIGHLYSLLVEKHSREAEPFFVNEHLNVLVNELELLQPDAVFLLGDITNNAKADEWATVQSALTRQAAPIYSVPGNHDLTRGIESFTKLGGEGSRSVVIGTTKYLLLGHESFPGALPNDTLTRFIDQELEDYGDYDNIAIMMHYLLKGNPFWEREIVPRIKGKVRHVFTGDLVRQHVKAQSDRDNDILYVSASIKFKGEGPAMFVVLDQSDSGLEAVPRIIPIALSQPWYEDDKDTETSADRILRILKRIPTLVKVASVLFGLVVAVLSLIGLKSVIRKLRR